jgi:hypothetical protein
MVAHFLQCAAPACGAGCSSVTWNAPKKMKSGAVLVVRTHVECTQEGAIHEDEVRCTWLWCWVFERTWNAPKKMKSGAVLVV